VQGQDARLSALGSCALAASPGRYDPLAGSDKSAHNTADNKGGSSPINRGHKHQRSTKRCSAREGRPRCLGGVYRGGGT
jgi:hypothetical protein